MISERESREGEEERRGGEEEGREGEKGEEGREGGRERKGGREGGRERRRKGERWILFFSFLDVLGQGLDEGIFAVNSSLECLLHHSDVLPLILHLGCITQPKHSKCMSLRSGRIYSSHSSS